MPAAAMWPAMPQNDPAPLVTRPWRQAPMPVSTLGKRHLSTENMRRIKSKSILRAFFCKKKFI
jgi:hypothetical protein